MDLKRERTMLGLEIDESTPSENVSIPFLRPEPHKTETSFLERLVGNLLEFHKKNISEVSSYDKAED
jgi:hypothetical protein